MSEPTRPSLSDRYWRLPWLARIGLVAVAVMGAVVVFTQVSRMAPDNDRSARTTPPAAAPSQQVAAGEIGPGVWLVGADIQPGTYRSSGPAQDGRYCMWSRHDTTSGGPMDGIITSDGTFDAEQMVVTIEAGDALFRTDGCAPWERAS